MNKKGVFILSIVLTAFLLTAAGGIARIVLAKTPVSQPAGVTGQYTGADVQQALDQQAAIYQEAIAQANRQLEQANQEIKRLSDQVNSFITASEAVPAYPVSADQALQVALTFTGDQVTLAKDPELVSYNSRAAYEVSFDKGVMYIDAQTAEVLFNNVVIPISEQKAREIAMQYMLSNQVIEVQSAPFQGMQVFKIRFSSNYVVYIDQASGQIVAVEVPRANPGSVANQSSASTPGDTSTASQTLDHEPEGDDD